MNCDMISDNKYLLLLCSVLSTLKFRQLLVLHTVSDAGSDQRRVVIPNFLV